MKRVSSMNLKLIRLRARTMQVQQPGLAILFALPVLLTILANFLLSGQDLVDLLPDMTLQQAGIYMIQRQLFPSVVSFVISILVVVLTFSYLDTINPKIEHRTRVLDIFKQIALPLYLPPWFWSKPSSFYGDSSSIWGVSSAPTPAFDF